MSSATQDDIKPSRKIEITVTMQGKCTFVFLVALFACDQFYRAAIKFALKRSSSLAKVLDTFSVSALQSYNLFIAIFMIEFLLLRRDNWAWREVYLSIGWQSK